MNGGQEQLQDDPLAELHKRTNEELSRELRTIVPGLSALFANDGTKSADPALRGPLVRMLEAEKSAPAALRPALLLSADQVAEKLWCEKQDSAECLQLRDEMARYNLAWQWDQLGAGWFYRHDLLWRLQQDAGTGHWNELAFLFLLDQGWDTSLACGKGSDQFREVIRQGEKFSAAHPDTAHKAEVFFLIAQAYETWWSLSKASKDDEYANPALYQEGAQRALEKAMEYYAKVAGVAPNHSLAGPAKAQLERLRQGKDTMQRRFFCIYD